MNRTIPEIRIKYAWLLANRASVVMNEKWGDGTPLRSFGEYVDTAHKYRQWWKPHNDTILHGICDIFNLEFRQNIIDVNVAPWFKAISDPMVIGPTFETEDALINTLSHELIHRLLTDNTSVDYEHDFITDWGQLFGDAHTTVELIHIPVHAGLKKLYLDVLDRPDLLAFDIENVQHNPDYAKAWEYVELHDYNDIIRQLGENTANEIL